MWFHLLSAAAFIALGSCRGYYSHEESYSSKAGKYELQSCKVQNCSDRDCPPCPLPYPIDCLNFCGTSDCPCVKPENDVMNYKGMKSIQNLRETNGKSKDLANAISTISVYPNGPVCSGFHILPNLVVTVSSCIAWWEAEDLFVTVNGNDPALYQTEPLNVVKIEAHPYNVDKVAPVVLVLEKPKVNVDYLAVPTRPIHEARPAEIHKWQVTSGGKKYEPMKNRLTSHSKCKKPHDQFHCAVTSSNVRMGWNDIGTPLVELSPHDAFALGLYTGQNLYQEVNMLKYMPLYEYSPWLLHLVEIYSDSA